MATSQLPRIDPDRGNLLAAGGVLLAAAVTLINTRLDASWGDGIHLIVALAAFVVVFGTAVRSPLPDRPLAYQSALALAGLALLVIVLLRVAQVFGADSPGSGTAMWISAVFAGVAVYAAMRFHSLAAALLAMLAVAIFVLAFVDKVFSPDGINTFRWFILLLALGFAAAAVHLRQGPREGWSVQAVNAAGLMLITLAITFFVGAAAAAISALGSGGSTGNVHAGFGWKAILVIGSLAVIGYAVATRERGPGYIGFASLLFAIVIISDGDSTLVGWPLVLLLAGGAAFALGLAPQAGTAGRTGGRGGTGGAPAGTAAPGSGPAGGTPPPAPESRQPPPG